MVIDGRVVDLIQQWHVAETQAADSRIPRHSPQAPIRHLAAHIASEGGWRGFIQPRAVCNVANWRYWYNRDRVWKIWKTLYARYRTGIWRTASNARAIRGQQQQQQQ